MISVPEIRDYHAINSEIVRHLDRGCRMIRLAGVRGQRLMASGLAGPWDATIEVDGDAGPGAGGRARRAGAHGRLSRPGRRRRGERTPGRSPAGAGHGGDRVRIRPARRPGGRGRPVPVRERGSASPAATSSSWVTPARWPANVSPAVACSPSPIDSALTPVAGVVADASSGSVPVRWLAGADRRSRRLARDPRAGPVLASAGPSDR